MSLKRNRDSLESPLDSDNASEDVTNSPLNIYTMDLKDETIWMFAEAEWKQNINNGLIEDPLYKNDTISQIVYLVLKSWIELERYCRGLTNTAVSSCSNILITGPKGVGKSTLMKGLKAIIDCNGINVSCIYFDFEQQPNYSTTPSVIIKERLKIHDSTPFDQVLYDSWVKEHKKAFIVMGDEIHVLYDIIDNQSVTIVKEFLSLGKSNFAQGIISGSAANVKSLVHKTNSSDSRRAKYPNLNHSVYTERRIEPLRSVDQFKHCFDIKRECCPATVQIDVTDVNKVFNATGGVGRYIGEYCKGSYTNTMIPDIIEIYEQSEWLVKCVIKQLYALNRNTTVAGAFSLEGIKNDDLLRNGYTVAAFTEMKDAGWLFYNSKRSHYEFMFPCHIQQLTQYFDPQNADGKNRLQKLAFTVTLKGWEGYGSAGQVLEPLLINRLIQQGAPPFNNFSVRCTYDEKELTKSAKNDSTSVQISQNVPIDRLLNQVFHLKQDFGIDGAVLNEYVNDEINVHIMQIKTGAFGKKITMGGQKATDSSQYFTAILKEVSHGWKKFEEFMKGPYPRIRFVLQSFALITSKQLVTEIQTKTKVTINESEVDFFYIDKNEFSELFLEELEECGIGRK